jgi:hypothetical protein
MKGGRGCKYGKLAEMVLCEIQVRDVGIRQMMS